MKNYLAIALLGIALASPVRAEGEIFATSLDGLIQADGKGMYDQILKLLNFKYQALPAARAEEYMSQSFGCLFPVDRRFMKISADFIQSDPIDVIKINVYSLKGGLETLDDIGGKSVGLRLGLNYGPKINALLKTKAKIQLAPNLESNLRKLKEGRVDLVLEFQLDVEEFQKAHPDYVFKVSKEPVDVHNDSITCYNNPVNQKLIASYDAALKAHRKAVDKIIGK